MHTYEYIVINLLYIYIYICIYRDAQKEIEKEIRSLERNKAHQSDLIQTGKANKSIKDRKSAASSGIISYHNIISYHRRIGIGNRE